jgi:ATP-dependent Clp protease ATP-binding subunit ClpC
MGEIYPEHDFFKEEPKGKSKRITALNSYGTDITQLALEDKLDPVVGRNDEIHRVIQILGRRRKNNPVLVGEAGVGKTAIVEGLALKIIHGDVPISLQGKKIYTLDISTIVAGTKYRGQFEERMKAIMGELIANPDIIVFIDEMHTLVGAGGAQGSLDASNIIKPALARGEIRCIGATTFDEFRENIEGDGALDRRFQKVTVEPSSYTETLEILKNIKDKYETHHYVKYSQNIIELIVKLADRYVTDRFFPDKAIDILDEVGSYKHLIKMKVPKVIKGLEETSRLKMDEKLKAVARQDYEDAARKRDEILEFTKKLDKAYTSWKLDVKKNFLQITEDDVLHVVSKTTGVPVSKISDREHKNLLGMLPHLNSIIIGQEEAVEKITINIQRNRVGIRKRDRTVGNFIFLGPTGVGKTQLAKELASYLFGSSDSLIRFDMSEFSEKHSISKFIGSPPGYVGHEEGGQLTERVRRKPHSLILFDEIEKAHPEIFNVMLQMLDDGLMTDGLGRTVDFRNCLIIMTSNTGSRTLQDFGVGVGFSTQASEASKAQQQRDVLMKALKNNFAPEFLNRIDEVIVFNKLGEEDIFHILETEIKELENNLKEVGGYKLKVNKAAKKILVKEGFDETCGARQLSRTLEKLIEDPISTLILKGELVEGDTITAKGSNDKIKIQGNGTKL